MELNGGLHFLVTPILGIIPPSDKSNCREFILCTLPNNARREGWLIWKYLSA